MLTMPLQSALPSPAERADTPSSAGGPAPATAWTDSGAAWRDAQYSPVKIDAVAQALAALGVDPQAALLQAGIQPGRLQDADYLTSTAQLYQLLQQAARLAPGPGLGRRIGQRLRITSYGMYGYALLSAPSLQAAMDSATRFHALANPLLPFRSVRSGDAVSWQFPQRHELLLPDLDDTLYRLLIEMQVTVHHTLATDVMGPWCRPTLLALPWAALPGPAGEADARAWAELLGCAPRHGVARGELRYPAAWLDRPPQLANAVTAVQASRECARLLATVASSASTVRQVYRALMQAPGQFPGLEALAESMGMTGRTLRRHLQAEGTSYAELLAKVRQALAEDYLRSTRMGLDDIAAALAFSDARSFRHAYTRWAGRSPSDFRRALACN